MGNDIKSLKPNQNGPYIQGYFSPTNRDKYVGKYPIIYRSSWELKLCKLCDTNKDILKWISEPNTPPFPVLYHHPIEDRLARYFPDYLIMKKQPDGSIINLMIEVKPEAQTVRFKDDGSIDPSSLPKKPAANATLKQRRNYIKRCQIILVNVAKKKAAEKLCAESGNSFRYHYLTEKFFDKIW